MNESALKPPCPLTVCILASGSKGNAIYVEDGETAILVDAGLSGLEIRRRMDAAGLDINRLKAIVVSHEHNDHVRGVGVLARRYDLPVYIAPGSARGAAAVLGRVDKLMPFEIGRTFNIRGLVVHPFSTSHDARDPAGFTIAANDHKIGIATDLGIATAMVKEHLKTCSLLVLEANHDPRMLIEGPYPWPLKQRIQSRNGHLSNQASRDLLGEVKHSGLCHVILAHLSETNNTPQKALEAVEQALSAADSHVRLQVARQDRCSDLLILE